MCYSCSCGVDKVAEAYLYYGYVLLYARRVHRTDDKKPSLPQSRVRLGRANLFWSQPSNMLLCVHKTAVVNVEWDQ